MKSVLAILLLFSSSAFADNYTFPDKVYLTQEGDVENIAVVGRSAEAIYKNILKKKAATRQESTSTTFNFVNSDGWNCQELVSVNLQAGVFFAIETPISLIMNLVTAGAINPANGLDRFVCIRDIH